MCSLSGELLSTLVFEEISKKLTVFGSDLASVINKIVPLQEVLIMGDDISLVEHVIKMLLHPKQIILSGRWIKYLQCAMSLRCSLMAQAI